MIVAAISERSVLIGFCIYILLFLFGVVGTAIIIRKRRRDRPPIKFKLLRGPGETLRNRVAKFDEDFLFRIGGAAFIPILAGLIVMGVMLKLNPQTFLQLYAGFGATVVVSLIALFFAGRWALRDLFRYSSDFLGYLGEREVAEHLRPLYAKGYHVYHDVPAEGSKNAFNLDHVTVGRTGVALIEVKTRRKGRARPGFKDHVVTYDGYQLIWPWGEERKAPEQAVNEAAWLQSWIMKRTGINTPVKPVLAIPGWWVERKAVGQVSVVNSKSVIAAIIGKGAPILNADQVDLIARQLDIACRDVE